MNTTMNIVKEIELAVSKLSLEQLDSFREWFDEFCCEVQEKAEVELSQAGKQKLEEALIEMEQGQTKEFDSVDDLIKDLVE